jgi:hypothetical protein
MAAKNAKRRAKFSPPDPAPAARVEVQIDSYEPNYGRQCEVCGESPTVTGVFQGRVVYDGSMCGVCTWGEAACRDPANW